MHYFWPIRIIREKRMITIGAFVWAYVTRYTDDDCDYDDRTGVPIFTSYNRLLIHVGRLHVIADWRR